MLLLAQLFVPKGAMLVKLALKLPKSPRNIHNVAILKPIECPKQYLEGLNLSTWAGTSVLGPAFVEGYESKVGIGPMIETKSSTAQSSPCKELSWLVAALPCWLIECPPRVQRSPSKAN